MSSHISSSPLGLDIYLFHPNGKCLMKVSAKTTRNVSLSLLTLKESLFNFLRIAQQIPLSIYEQGNYVDPDGHNRNAWTTSVDRSIFLFQNEIEDERKGEEGDEEKIVLLTLFEENGINIFFTQYENLNNFMFSIGCRTHSSLLWDNWCDKSIQTLDDVMKIIEHRTVEYYVSNDRSGNSFRLLSDRQFTCLSQQDLSSEPNTPIPLHRFGREELREICEVVSLVLTPRLSIPINLFRVSIRTSRTTLTDSPSGKLHTLHSTTVRQDDLEWSIQYRYSDFARLHDQLSSQEEKQEGFIPRQNLPHFPGKKLLQSSSLVSPSNLDRRRVKLSRYINSLLSLEQALSNKYVRAFLHIPGNAISDSSEVNQRLRRDTIHVSKLNTEARWGDLILFKCNANTHSRLLAPVSSWEWDHVGLVVLSQAEFPEGDGQEIVDNSMVSLDILEATTEGVTLYPLTGRLRAYNYNNLVQYMGIRKLRGFPRTLEMARKLNEFVLQMVGKTSGISPTKLPGKKRTSSPKAFHLWQSFSDDVDSEINPQENSVPPSPLLSSGSLSEIGSFFNAEIISSALKTIGIIPKHYNPEYFWPGAFAHHDELDLLTSNQSYGYGEELILDCRLMEVNRAVERLSLRRDMLFKLALDDEEESQEVLSTLPESPTRLSHYNSSQATNMALDSNHSDLLDEPPSPPGLQHVSSYGVPNKALSQRKPGALSVLDTTIEALNDDSSDDTDDADEIRKAAVRGMPKSQSLKELRINSKHVVSQGIAGEINGVSAEVVQQANSLLMSGAEDD